jgi:hypothetical protein
MVKKVVVEAGRRELFDEKAKEVRTVPRHGSLD